MFRLACTPTHPVFFKLCIVFFSVVIHAASAQVFDFTAHDFEKNGPRSLRGDWMFHWDTLFTSMPVADSKRKVKMPHYWSEGNPGSFGMATYSTRIKLSTNQSQLAIHIPFIRCAGRVFVNGQFAGSVGTVGNESTYRSQLGSLLITLPQKTEVDLVVQVANYEYRWAGLSSNMRIGKNTDLLNSIKIKQGFDIFFVGSLLAMAIYLVTMYYLYRQGYSFLFLALICMAVVLRSLTTESGSLFLPDLFPKLGWEPWKKIEFFSVYAIVALFPLYVSHVFPNESNKKMDWIFIGLASLLCLVVVFTQHYIFVALLDVAHIGLLVGFVYAVLVATKALRKKNPDAKILFIGILVAFPFIFLEILKNSALQVPIPFTHLVEFGVLAFLLFQVYVLANHYAMTYQSLEVLVKKRTEELTQSNEINNRMLAILSHDVKGPVNSLKAVMSVFNQGQLSEGDLRPLAIQIEAQAGSISLLIENVLLWVRTQISGIEISWETFVLANWVNPHLDLYQIQAKSRGIILKSNLPTNLLVKSDKQVISLVIRNLISNAIKFANENSTVTISAQEETDIVKLTVINTGPGMTPEQIQAVFLESRVVKSQGSTGLGLKLCRTYLTAMNSDLEISSKPNGVTSISIQLLKIN